MTPFRFSFTCTMTLFAPHLYIYVLSTYAVYLKWKQLAGLLLKEKWNNEPTYIAVYMGRWIFFLLEFPVGLPCLSTNRSTVPVSASLCWSIL
jgi:hypothetical protein